MTLDEALSGRANALNFVRLVLAAAVIVSHTWPLMGFGRDPQFGDLTLGAWAVAGFFGISGYLISASRDRLRLRDFAIARVLRIFPGYWCALVLVAVGFAPIAAAITHTPVEIGGAARYVIENITTWPRVWVFGDAMKSAAWPENWNGPVWTLSHELGCYILIGGALSLRWIRWRPVLFAAALWLAATGFNCVMSVWGFGRGYMPLDFMRLLAFFAAGVLLWTIRRRVRLDGWIACAALILFVLIAAVGHTDDVGALPAAYLVLWTGARLPVTWAQRTDLSYGMYVYGWPVGTLIGLAGGKWLGPLVVAAITLGLAAGLAALSWRFVEQPALKLRAVTAARVPSAVVTELGGAGRR